MLYNIYTDGSYKDIPPYGQFYAGAAVIYDSVHDQPISLLSKVGTDELITMRNVAGEIIAVMMAMEHCLNVLKLKNDDTVVLHYDYQGIEAWTLPKGTKGAWRAKNSTTQAYSAYINTIVRPRFKVQFDHVKGHSGVEGNELADKLAKNAIDQHVVNLGTGIK